MIEDLRKRYSQLRAKDNDLADDLVQVRMSMQAMGETVRDARVTAACFPSRKADTALTDALAESDKLATREVNIVQTLDALKEALPKLKHEIDSTANKTETETRAKLAATASEAYEQVAEEAHESYARLMVLHAAREGFRETQFNMDSARKILIHRDRLKPHWETARAELVAAAGVEA